MGDLKTVDPSVKFVVRAVYVLTQERGTRVQYTSPWTENEPNSRTVTALA